jgi:hypothetical protein
MEVRVPKPPTVLHADGAHALIYEGHLTNLSAATSTLRRFEVLSEADNTLLLALEDTVLASALGRPGLAPPPAPAARAAIGAGLRAVVFLWFAVDGTPPSRLYHRLTLVRGAGDSLTSDTIERGAVPVFNARALISPPLRGGPWLSANGPAPLSGHRRALITAGDLPTISQRFAIDYVKLDSASRTHVGDAAINANYYAHGEDALAVADGIVAATKDSIPENVPGINSRAVPITLETIGGNHVIIDIGAGNYAFYAHLQPGSLRVKKGDRVRRGQVIGLVGNSGNSTEPHLHFHISDSPSPLGSEGVPYVHERFDLLGRCVRTLGGCAASAVTGVTREMPRGGMIVRFPR